MKEVRIMGRTKISCKTKRDGKKYLKTLRVLKLKLDKEEVKMKKTKKNETLITLLKFN